MSVTSETPYMCTHVIFWHFYGYLILISPGAFKIKYYNSKLFIMTAMLGKEPAKITHNHNKCEYYQNYFSSVSLGTTCYCGSQINK
jgi:hypothetical protein